VSAWVVLQIMLVPLNSVYVEFVVAELDNVGKCAFLDHISFKWKVAA
jgi:hypothetical protein